MGVWSYLRRPNWSSATDTPLYTSKRIKKWLLVVLWLVVALNSTLFVLCVIGAATGSMYWYYPTAVEVL